MTTTITRTATPRRKALALGAAALCLTGATVTASATAAQAATCTKGVGGSHSHWDARRSIQWPQDWTCGNASNISLYGFPKKLYDPIGIMYSSPSWFVCWQYGEKHSGGNTVWYYTQGDKSINEPSFHAWGWIPASQVYTPQDPLSGMTRCSFSM